MNVELTIQAMFDEYPALFKERSDCLNHLFCTIGNGYNWVDGELVNVFDDEYIYDVAALKSHLVDEKAFQHNKMSLRDEHIFYFNQMIGKIDEYSEVMQERIRNVTEKDFEKFPADQYHRKPRKYRWCFYVDIPGHEHIDYHKKYAKMWNYPENIKPDWLAAIEECKSMLREDGFEV